MAVRSWFRAAVLRRGFAKRGRGLRTAQLPPYRTRFGLCRSSLSAAPILQNLTPVLAPGSAKQRSSEFGLSTKYTRANTDVTHHQRAVHPDRFRNPIR